MKKTLTHFLIVSLFFLFIPLSDAQEVLKPTKVSTPAHFDISQPLSKVKHIKAEPRKRSWKESTVKNKFGFLEEFKNPPAYRGVDPVLQDYTTQNRTSNIIQNFPGIHNLNNVAPPDTDGDVSPNHYVQMVNLSFAIWDKNGTQLVSPADNQTIWEGFDDGKPYDNANDGDPIVLYDEAADRWLVSQFAVNTTNSKYYELIAISTTSDPTGSWYRYAFEFDDMPDYPKFGVWSDGYYMAINQFANAAWWAGGGACAFERDKMLQGDPNAKMVFFDLGSSIASMLPSDIDGINPPANSPNIFVSMTTNQLKMWEFKVDWNNTSNSTFTALPTLATQTFNYSGINIKQKGTTQTLMSLADRLMYRLQYRNFGDYEVLLTNHTVNADGNGQAGIRWYELRNTGSGWSIHQQGTYAPNDGLGRWVGSIAMDANGNIALGYSVSGDNLYPSIRYCGQSAGAPSGLGIMDIAETSIKEGTAYQTGTNRWGDYAMMSVDPSDGATFWFTTEYSGGGWNWKTQIASFQIETPTPVAPVANFDAQVTEIIVGNAIQFNDQSTNNPTSWAWEFEGGTPATSTDQNPSITYNTDGTYKVKLTVSNAEGSDSKEVLNYITVNPIQAPVAAFTADNTSITTANQVNFTDNSTNIPTSWAWEFEGGTPATSTDQNPSITYNAAGTYKVKLTATNSAGSNSIETDDYITVEDPVLNYCESKGNNNTYEWIAGISIGTFSKTSTGSNYSDFTSDVIELASGSHSVTLTPGFSGSGYTEHWKIWIDFNKDGDFADSGEQVLSNSSNAVINSNIDIPASATGQTRLRVSMKYNAAPGKCETFSFGEVEDYTVSFSRGLMKVPFISHSLELYPNPVNDYFTLNLGKIELSGDVAVKIMDVNGKIVYNQKASSKIISINVENLNSGVYAVQITSGDDNAQIMFVKK
ncbi:MAG: PKD domain-containing protein [Hyphomicrobiales bacterium]